MRLLTLLSVLLSGCATNGADDSVAIARVDSQPVDTAPDDGAAPDPGAEPDLRGSRPDRQPMDTGFGDTGAFRPVPTGAPTAASTLDATPSKWSVTASGAMVPLTNAAGLYADGSVLYMASGKVKLRRPSGTIETVANSGTNAIAIGGGPTYGAAFQTSSGFSVAWRGTNGTWTTTSLSYTTGGGSPTPSACVDAEGNGTLALVNSTAADPEGTLVLFPITASVVGRPVTYAADDEVTSPSVVCSDTGADELVWRHQLSGTAEIWHASIDAGRVTGATKAVDGAYDPSYAADQWVGYHVGGAQTYLAHSSDRGATFAAARSLATISKFVTVRTSGKVIAALYSTWPTTEQAQDPTRYQANRVAHLQVSLDGGVTWTTRDPYGTAGGYGPCGLTLSTTAVIGGCKSPEGVAGFTYAIR